MKTLTFFEKLLIEILAILGFDKETQEVFMARVRQLVDPRALYESAITSVDAFVALVFLESFVAGGLVDSGYVRRLKGLPIEKIGKLTELGEVAKFLVSLHLAIEENAGGNPVKLMEHLRHCPACQVKLSVMVSAFIDGAAISPVQIVFDMRPDRPEVLRELCAIKGPLFGEEFMDIPPELWGLLKRLGGGRVRVEVNEMVRVGNMGIPKGYFEIVKEILPELIEDPKRLEAFFDEVVEKVSKSPSPDQLREFARKWRAEYLDTAAAPAPESASAPSAVVTKGEDSSTDSGASGEGEGDFTA